MTQIYFITGASRGLGLEFVKQLSSQEGNIVYAGARNPENSKALMNLVDNKKVFAITINIDSKYSIESAAEMVSKTATEGIDVLINNAAISNSGSNLDQEHSGPLQSPKSEYVRVFETNVGGVSDVTQAFVPLLRKRGNDKIKRIVNITSIMSSVTLAVDISSALGAGNTAYKVSKAALNMLTALFADTLASESFVVVVVHPGWVQTDMGGENAEISAHDSVSNILSTIGSLNTADNGRFLKYSGEALPW